MNNTKKDILNGIYAQINAFDNKANIAISAISIAFAICIAFISIDQLPSIKDCLRLQFNIWLILFIVFGIFTIFSFIMVIRPRKSCDINLYPNYYKDIVKMSHDTNLLKKQISNWSRNDSLIINQIKINADICNKKHRWFCIGLFAIIPLIIALVALLCLVVINFN